MKNNNNNNKKENSTEAARHAEKHSHESHKGSDACVSCSHEHGHSESHLFSNKHHHRHQHGHNHAANEKTIKGLIIAFIINMLLSLAEIAGGIIGGSIALIADALHNAFDAFSILIAVIAYKIGKKNPDDEYTFGYKRAETIGGFINLILLFVSGLYLMCEGIGRLFKPEEINGSLIIWISVIALIIDAATAKLSHSGAHGSSNMKMLFIHNLADAFGSIGVIASGLCVIYLGWNFIDGIVAILIAAYMISQAIVSFKPIMKILMNAMPEGLSADAIKSELLQIKGVKDIHHIHIWNIDEGRIAFACHAVAADIKAGELIKQALNEKFSIEHSTIQIETDRCACDICC